MKGHEAQQPIKNQLLEICFEGKWFKICSEGQMNYILAVGMQEIQHKAAMEQKALTEEEADAELQKFKKNCGFSTLKDILANLTPEEKERWQMNYRFAPVIKRTES